MPGFRRVLRRTRLVDAQRSSGAPWRCRAPGRAAGSAEDVPVAPVGDLAPDLRGLLVGEPEVDAGPDAGLDDVLSQLREARELPRHAARRSAGERRFIPA